MSVVLSFFVPGLGHMLNGRVFQGLFFLVLVPVGYLISIPLLCIPGLLLHLFVMLDAGKDARRRDEQKMAKQAEVMARAMRER